MKSEVVNFEPNIPVQLALKFAEGRNVESRFGFRTMYSGEVK